MNEHTQDAARSALELRSRELFEGSVEGLDMRVRSRLTQARHAATAAVLLGTALWFGSPAGNHAMTAADQSSLEDLDMVASTDEGSGDAMEMLQNDLDFYDFADKAANSGPAA